MTWLVAGCGHSPTDRCAVSGAITLDDRPVDGGNIQICPIDSKQASVSGALIQAGRYSIPCETGLTPGKYRVRIYWAEKIDPKLLEVVMDGSRGPRKNPPQAKERIPVKYNAESELTIEVRQDGANKFDFKLSAP